MKKQNILFLIFIFFVFSFGCLTLVREEKGISKRENRDLQKFEHFTLKSYLKGEYQNKLESAMSDQFIGSETIKIKLKSFLKILNYNNIPENICKNNYVYFGNDSLSFDCNDYLLHQYVTDNDKKIETTIKQKMEQYNKINKEIDTYYYFIPTPKIYNFKENNYSINIKKILEESIENEKAFGMLEFNDFNEYSEYFYKTDHHWNHKGSYKAYKDIIYMFNRNAKIIEPLEELTFSNILFYGSIARFSQILDYKETFKVYKFDLPNMRTLINGVETKYGNKESYFANEVESDIFSNHYAYYYGDDYAEVFFEGNSGKQNLLIISNSFSNSINEMIATHFNKTYDVDLRQYTYIFNGKFNIKNYIEQNDIDKVLFIMDYSYLMEEKFNIEWVE